MCINRYVLFAVGRRSELRELHPELSFAEITKLLGHEWSTLPSRQKKVNYYTGLLLLLMILGQMKMNHNDFIVVVDTFTKSKD